MNIKDPRRYSVAYPHSNALINIAVTITEAQNAALAMNDKNALSHDHGDNNSNHAINKATEELNALLNDLLRDGNDTMLNLAINLAPSYASARLIWGSIKNVIDNNSKDLDIFVIPIVIIAGNLSSLNNAAANNKATNNQANITANNVAAEQYPHLRNTIINKEALKELCSFTATNSLVRNHSSSMSNGLLDLLNNNKEVFKEGFVLPKLFTAPMLSTISPSIQYQWHIQNDDNSNKDNMNSIKLSYIKNWIIQNIFSKDCKNDDSTIIQEESVHLRYLFIATVKNQKNRDYYSGSAFKKSLSSFLVNDLAANNLSLFIMPFAPVDLFNAFTVGNGWRKEVALQVMLSNVVRQIRQQAKIPVAYLSSGDNDLNEDIGIYMDVDAMEVHTNSSINIDTNMHANDNIGAIYIIVVALSSEDVAFSGTIPTAIKKCIDNKNGCMKIVWRLNQIDDFAYTINTITHLMQGMQIRIATMEPS